jgi:uncharacterized RDD family membrane protein YckC
MESSPPLPHSIPETPRVTPSGASPTVDHVGPPVTLRPAPLHKRVLAYLVDWGILGATGYLFVFLSTVLMAFLVSFFSDQLQPFFVENVTAVIIMVLLVLMILLVFFSLVHLYFIYYHLNRGATPGKHLFGLKVISLDGRPLSRRQCILRECLIYIDVGFLFPGLISILATPRNQRLGDLAAGTMVTHSTQTEDQDHYLYITQEEYHTLRDVLTLEPISPHLSDEYSKFAYHYFITKQVVPSSDELVRWETRIRHSMINAEEYGLDQQSVLLFFAEHCFQTARS